MSNLRLQKPLEDYIAYWQSLSVRSLALLDRVADPMLRFTGPLHQVQGTEAAQAVVAGLLRDLDRARIRITDHAWGRDGQTAYLRWTLVFFPGGGKAQWTVQGVSELMFNAEGRVASHIDHWDVGTQILSRLRRTRWVCRAVYRRIAR